MYFVFILNLQDEESGISEEIRKEQQSRSRLLKLFCNTKFFLGRETPRESLTFILRYRKTNINDQCFPKLLHILKILILLKKKLFFFSNYKLNRCINLTWFCKEKIRFIRNFGAKVSWDPSVSAGATYLESDETITHQIVDRNQPPAKKYMNRYYVQPQWVRVQKL